MKLQNLEIKFNTYGSDKGTYTGEATFSGATGRISLNLNSHHCEQMFLVCADGIVDVAKAAARMFVQEAMHGTEAAKQRQLSSKTVGDIVAVMAGKESA